MNNLQDVSVALSVISLNKTYTSGQTALKDFSLTISAGDFFALLGPNGAGKTTLIGIISGLVTKTSGQVKIFGLDQDISPENTRRLIGLVPQELNLDIFEKPIDVLVNQAGYYGIPRKEAIERAEKLLRDLGLFEKRFGKVMQLSGGMKRRLLIARALIHSPRFLILDEPTAGVDVELRRSMWDYLRNLTKDGITILLTTHYLEEAEMLAQNVLILNKGEIVVNGSMREILTKISGENLEIVLEKDESSLAQKILLEGGYQAEIVDRATIKIVLSSGEMLSNLIRLLDGAGIVVKTARGGNGKLEEVFVRLTQTKEVESISNSQ